MRPKLSGERVVPTINRSRVKTKVKAKPLGKPLSFCQAAATGFSKWQLLVENARIVRENVNQNFCGARVKQLTQINSHLSFGV